jgi:probable F420-dependent oxidoreductase
MKFGIWTFCTDYSMAPGPLAQAVEERGFDSFWLPEHTHIPSQRITPYPAGGELPEEYAHTLDPFVGLAAAAMTTSTLELGTGVCLVPQRDPIALAKSVASLDQLSGGRFLFGIGGGWNREELEHHGVSWERRFRIMRERVEAMQAIWTQEEASYSGEFVNFEKIWSWP